jgi:hypothetical protein
VPVGGCNPINWHTYAVIAAAKQRPPATLATVGSAQAIGGNFLAALQ